MKPLFLALFLFTLVSLYGQTELERQLEGRPNDQKITVYNDTANNLDNNSIDLIYNYSLRALALLRTAPNAYETARAYFNLSRVGFFIGDTAMQQNYLERAYSLDTGDNALKAEITYQLATVYGLTNPALAAKKFRESYRLATTETAKNQALLGEAVALRQDKQFTASLAILNTLPNNAEVYNEWGNLLADQQNQNDAIVQWNQALALATESQNNNVLIQAYYALANTYFNNNDMVQAIAYGQQALLMAGRYNNTAIIIKSQQLLANAYLEQGLTTQAFNMLKQNQETQLRVLENEQQALSLFSHNIITASTISEENTRLTNQLKDQKNLNFILMIIASALLVALLIFIQRWHSKSVEEKTATLAYNVLIRRSQTKRLSLRGRALNLWAGNKIFTLYHITVNCPNNKWANNLMITDYMVGFVQEKLEQELSSIEFFRNSAQANIFYLLIPNQSIDSLVVDEILADNHTFKITWQNETTEIALKIEKFYNNNTSMANLEQYLTQHQTNLFF